MPRRKATNRLLVWRPFIPPSTSQPSTSYSHVIQPSISHAPSPRSPSISSLHALSTLHRDPSPHINYDDDVVMHLGTESGSSSLNPSNNGETDTEKDADDEFAELYDMVRGI